MCVADHDGSIQVIDVANPSNPRLMGSVETPGYTYGVAISGNYAYAADFTLGLQVVDISNPASPQIVGGVDTPGEAMGVAVSANYGYVAGGSSGLQIVLLQCEGQSAVYMMYLDVARDGQRAVLHWEISRPRAHAGFRVWRESEISPRILLGDATMTTYDVYEFVDLTPPTGTADYWLQEITTDGSESWYGPARLSAAALPNLVTLEQNHPNPFNPQTTIGFALPTAGRVTLTIFDLRGQQVSRLKDEFVSAGLIASIGRPQTIRAGRCLAGRTCCS